MIVCCCVGGSDAFAYNLVGSKVGCLTELATSEVIMNNRVVAANESDYPNVRLVLVHLDNEPKSIIEVPFNQSLPYAMWIRLQSPYQELSDRRIEYTIETKCTSTTSENDFASFPEVGGCEDQKRAASKSGPTDLGIFYRIDHWDDPKGEFHVWGGWATGHEKVRLMEPIIFRRPLLSVIEPEPKRQQQQQIISQQQEQQHHEQGVVADVHHHESISDQQEQQRHVAEQLHDVHHEVDHEQQHQQNEHHEAQAPQDHHEGEQQHQEEEHQVHHENQQEVHQHQDHHDSEQQRLLEDHHVQEQQQQHHEEGNEAMVHHHDEHHDEEAHLHPEFDEHDEAHAAEELQVKEELGDDNEKLEEAAHDAKLFDHDRIKALEERLLAFRGDHHHHHHDGLPDSVHQKLNNALHHHRQHHDGSINGGGDAWPKRAYQERKALNHHTSNEEIEDEHHHQDTKHNTNHGQIHGMLDHMKEQLHQFHPFEKRDMGDFFANRQKFLHASSSSLSSQDKTEERTKNWQERYESESFGAQGPFSLQHYAYGVVFFVVSNLVVMQLCLMTGKREKVAAFLE